MNRIQKIAIATSIVGSLMVSYSFCGFFVAKAGSELFNKASSVIMVRDGNNTTITMSNDFQGKASEFAMVVPVPVVLKREQIDIADASVFEKLDAYSAPRLAEYYDEAPCGNEYEKDGVEDMIMTSAPAPATAKAESMNKKSKVKIEARYEVGEYDILILSAKESDGLQQWLTSNGYKIPAKAKEVLQPYVKSKMKFFVVKVNMEKYLSAGFTTLRPLKISFDSPKFMLPIRLGMANAKDYQDLIIYAISKNGRVETTNYRTIPMPTDKDVPLSISTRFGEFYKATFDKTWAKQKNVSYLEYAWNLENTNPVKCDPCQGPVPDYALYQQIGANWVQYNRSQGGYEGKVFITRLHVRYDRLNFPQDLVFQETSNKERFQCRYVLHHPAYIGVPCDETYSYYQTVLKRRKEEVRNLNALTGWATNDFKYYAEEYNAKLGEERERLIQEGKQNIIQRGGIGSVFENVSFGGESNKIWTLLLLGALILGAYRLSLKEE